VRKFPPTGAILDHDRQLQDVDFLVKAERDLVLGDLRELPRSVVRWPFVNRRR
jgi:hypothetical protein